MTTRAQDPVEQIDAAIKRWQRLRAHWQYRTLQALGADPFMSLRIELITDLVETVEGLSPAGTRYPNDAHAALGEHGLGSAEAGDALVRILESLRDDQGACSS